MFNVVLALLPVCAFAVYAFGLAALLVLLTAVAVLRHHRTSALSIQWPRRRPWATGRSSSRACFTG